MAELKMKMRTPTITETTKRIPTRYCREPERVHGCAELLCHIFVVK